MTEPSVTGDGVGFDATWYGDFQHHIVEFDGGGYAQLIEQAGFGDARPLQMDYFAGALTASGSAKIVYHESHDDCGNRTGSARTMWLAVNGAPLVGATRDWAESPLAFRRRHDPARWWKNGLAKRWSMFRRPWVEVWWDRRRTAAV